MTDEEKREFSKIITELCNDFRRTIKEFNERHYPVLMKSAKELIRDEKSMRALMKSSEVTLRALCFELGYTHESLRSFPQDIIQTTIEEEMSLGREQFLREVGEFDESPNERHEMLN